MMKKNWKRLHRHVALLICLTLFIALLPTPIVRAAEQADDLFFDFRKGYVYNTMEDHIQAITYEKTTPGGVGELKPAVFSDPWQYYSWSPAESGAYMRYLSNSGGIAVWVRNSVAAFTFKVEYAGYYHPRALIYYHATAAGNMRITLSRITEEGTIGEQVAQLNEDCAVTTGSFFKSFGDSPLYLDAGTYAVSFQPTQRPAGHPGRDWVVLDALALDHVKIAPEVPSSVAVGESLDIPALTNGAVAQVTGLQAEIADSSIADVQLFPETGTVRVIGRKPGTTPLTISASGTFAGSVTVPVTVYDPNAVSSEEILFNFQKANTSSSKNQQQLESISTYRLSTPGATGERKAGTASAPWKYHTWSGNLNGYFLFSGQGYGAAMYQSASFSYLLLVPRPGKYAISPLLGYSSGSGGVTMTLAPVNAAGHADTTRQLSLGTVDTYDALETRWGVPTQLPGEYDLAAGEYIFTVENTTRSQGTKPRYWSVIDGVLLTPIIVDPKLTIDLSDTADTAVNEDNLIPVAVNLVGGVLDPDALEFIIETEPVGVAAAEVVKQGGSLFLKLAGVSEGSAQVAVTAKLGELTDTQSVAVTVAPESDRVLSIVAEVPQGGIPSSKATDIPLNLSFSDGRTIDYATAQIEAVSSNIGIAEVAVVKSASSAKLNVTGIKVGGPVEITVTAKVGNKEAAQTLTFAVTGTKRDLYYNFMKCFVAGKTDEAYVKSLTYANTTSGSASEINAIKSDPWAYHSGNTKGGNNYFKYNYANYGFAFSQDGTVSLRFRVPVGGRYMPQAVVYLTTEAPATLQLRRINPEDGTSGETLATKAVEAASLKTFDLSDEMVEFEAGEYALSITRASKKGLAIIDGLALIDIEGKLTISSTEFSVVKGETSSTELVVKDYLGNEVPLDELNYSVTVADDTIAAAEFKAAGDSLMLELQGKKIARTTATVTLSTKDNTKYGTFTVPIITTADFDLQIGMDIPSIIELGSSIEIPVSAKFVRKNVVGEEAPVNITVKVSSPGILNASVVTGEENKNNKLSLTTAAAGSISLEVKISNTEVIKTYRIPILVAKTDGASAKNFKYMIYKAIPNGIPVSNVSDFNKTIIGSGEQLRPGAVTDTWAHFGQSEGVKFISVSDAYGSALEDGVGQWASLMIRLPESGIYQPVTQHALYPMAGIMRIYLAPADAENPRDPKWSLGSKDTFMPGTKDDIIRVFFTPHRTTRLSAGDYIVSWEIIDENPDVIAASPRIYIGGLMLNAVDTMPEITLDIQRELEVAKYNRLEIPLDVVVSDETEEDLYGAEISVTPKSGGIVDTQIVTRGRKNYLSILGTGVGSVTLDIEVKISGTVRATQTVSVDVLEPEALDKVDVAVEGLGKGTSISLHQMDINKNRVQLKVKIFDENGKEIPAESAELQQVAYSYESSDISVATVDANGLITALKVGDTQIRVTVTMSGVTKVGVLELQVTHGKTASSYYTEKKLANARNNITRYPWAAAMRKTAVEKAEKYLDQEERLWNSVTTQELSRSYYTGYRADPNFAKCRYCGVDIAAKYGSAYGWLRNAYNDPWKIQCPDCKRRFPSNDFGSFYQAGIDESGNWSYEKAKRDGQEYLKNTLYPEKDKELGITGWGVDDGYGYDTGNTYPSGLKEVHTYISFYNHWGVWHGGIVLDAVSSLKDAYLYTGEAKYGRAGAILIDRIADVYPDMKVAPYFFQFIARATKDVPWNPKGKVVDYVWENQLVQMWAQAYDAFYPMYEDSSVIRFLSDKAKQYPGMENKKTDASSIRANCEDGILREIFRAAKTADICGNFGMNANSVATAAVVLDSMPETIEMLDWVFHDGLLGDAVVLPLPITGANVNRQIINNVDRDGFAGEIAPNYVNLWTGGLNGVINALKDYDKYPVDSLIKNPRLTKMLSALPSLIMSRRSSIQLGDSGATADNTRYLDTARIPNVFRYNKLPVFAQTLYFANGNKLDNLHYDIFTENPNSMQDDIRLLIEKYGEYDFDKSEQLCGYGLSILRGGSLYGRGTISEQDTQRTFWMSYNRYSGHTDYNSLTLGIEALGLNLAPELGYPTTVTGDTYYNWFKSTVAHNTVVVNNNSQGGVRETGKPLHFDDSGMVKLMDSDDTKKYSSVVGGVSIYRRSVVTVDIDDENSYGVDFFRIKGGNEHVYSFHALTDRMPETEGLSLVPQVNGNGNYIGSYAGPTVAYGTEGMRSGYSYLKNVDRSPNVKDGNFMVDFHIKDFRKQLKNSTDDIHLRMTMLNGFDLSEVAFADGNPPLRDKNPSTLKYVLARRSGSNLDTLFTTVFEPYKGESAIVNMEAVTNIKRADGNPLSQDEVVRAVRVELADKRVDYVVYAADNSVEYIIDDLFNIRGFIGVYTLKAGSPVYAYVNDGDKIGDIAGVGSYTGRVLDFTKELSSNNSITVAMDGAVDLERVIGQYVYIDKQGAGNAVYPIKNAIQGEGNTVIFDIGDITLIESVLEDEYTHNIAAGQTFRIPLPLSNNTSPVFSPIDEKNVDANSEIRFSVSASSPADKPLTYRAVLLPRGASFNPVTQTVVWRPDAHQVGLHHVSIEASDGALSAVAHFEINVYGATSGGGGGGGQKPGSDPKPDPKPDPNPNPNPGSYEHFKDLAGFDWAKDAINALADAGIIKGMTANTYAPGLGITRADFAILFVRAFKLTERAKENFADVAPGKYYADELLAAKASGLINGVGENRFAPELRISRQDMALIVYRALLKQGYEFGEGKSSTLRTFSDAGEVSDYAREAMEALVRAGFLTGSNGALNPKANTTRAEVAVLLDRVIKK